MVVVGRSAIFSRRPVLKLSRIVTAAPLANKPSTKCDPIKPAPPVTKTCPIYYQCLNHAPFNINLLLNTPAPDSPHSATALPPDNAANSPQTNPSLGHHNGA